MLVTVVCKFPEPCWYRHNIQGSPRTFITPNRWSSITVDRAPTLIDPGDDKYEQGLGILGAGIAAGIYSMSYPIVWLDGPLPFIDAAWLMGLYRISKAGYEVGSFVGEVVDLIV